MRRGTPVCVLSTNQSLNVFPLLLAVSANYRNTVLHLYIVHPCHKYLALFLLLELSYLLSPPSCFHCLSLPYTFYQPL